MRLVSDLRVVCNADAGKGGNAGADDVDGTSSVSIIS